MVAKPQVDIGEYQYGFRDEEDYVFKSGRGLTRATVEEIRSELADASSPSSIRKLLDIMIERGLLIREYDGPRFVYFPAVKPEAARRSALKQLVRTFFDNSPGSAIAALLDMTSTSLSAADYRRLSSLLKRVSEKGDEP